MKRNKKIHSFRMNIEDIELLKYIAEKESLTQIEIVEYALHQYFRDYQELMFMNRQ